MEIDRGCRNVVTRPLNQVYLTRQWNSVQYTHSKRTIFSRHICQKLPSYLEWWMAMKDQNRLDGRSRSSLLSPPAAGLGSSWGYESITFPRFLLSPRYCTLRFNRSRSHSITICLHRLHYCRDLLHSEVDLLVVISDESQNSGSGRKIIGRRRNMMLQIGNQDLESGLKCLKIWKGSH